MRLTNTIKKIACIILVVLSIVATILKILFSIDIDECYVMHMAYRALQGDRLLADTWDLHQTSRWLSKFWMSIYMGVTGNVEGLVVYMRIITTVLLFLISLYMYLVLKRYFGKMCGFLCAAFYFSFLPRFTQNMEYGLISLSFLVLTFLFLLQWYRESNNQFFYLIAGGGCYALSILCYPTTIVSVPVIAFILAFSTRQVEKKRVHLLFFFLICLANAVAVLIYLLQYLTLDGIIYAISEAILDGSHEGGLDFWGRELPRFLKHTGLYVIIAVGIEGIRNVIEKRGSESFFIFLRGVFSSVCLVSSCIFIFIELLGIHRTGPQGMGGRYLAMAVMAAVAFAKDEDRFLYGWIWVGIVYYFGVLLGSNQGVTENAPFLMCAVLVGVIMLIQDCDIENNIHSRIYELLCIVILVLGVIFNKAYLPRVSGLFASTIFEDRVKISEGVLKGIYVRPDEVKQYELALKEIEQSVYPDDYILVIGQDPIYYMMTSAKCAAATSITTPFYGKQWIDWYTEYNKSLPSVIIINKDFWGISLEQFRESLLGEYLIDELGYSISFDGEGVATLRPVS